MNNERLTTRDIAEVLAYQTGLDKKRAEGFIDALSSFISGNIEKNKAVRIIGLGTFKIVLVRERESVHIQTGERFVIPTHHKLSFIPDRGFKDQINRPFAFFEPVEAMEDFKPQKVTFKRTQESDLEDIVKQDEIPDDNDILQIEPEADEIVEPEADEIVEPEADEKVEPAVDEIVEPEADEKVEEPLKESVNDNKELLTSTTVEEINKDKEKSMEKKSETDNKRKILPSWFWWFFLPAILFVGGILGGFGFLYFIYERSNDKEIPLTVLNSEYSSESPLIGGILLSDTTIIDDTATIEILDGGLELPSRVDSSTNVQASDSISRTTERRTVGNWIAETSSDNVRTESRRATRPNEEIERNNRALASGTSTPQSTTTQQPSAQTPAAASAEKKIPDRVRISAGSSLRQIAAQHYGNAVFWVYIFEHNKERINNPNNVPVGTELRMPLPRTYGIDSKNASSVQRATTKQSELYRLYGDR
jgi:Bacterial nucleoid DNA-binding protein